MLYTTTFIHHFLKQPWDRFPNLQLPFSSYLYVLPYIYSMNRRTYCIPGPLLGGQNSTARHPIWDKELHSLPMKTSTVNTEFSLKTVSHIAREWGKGGPGLLPFPSLSHWVPPGYCLRTISYLLLVLSPQHSLIYLFWIICLAPWFLSV